MRISISTSPEEQPTIGELQQKAFMLEQRKIDVQPPFSPSKMILLETLLDTVHTELQPSIQDYRAREDAIDFVNALVRDRVSVDHIRKRFGLCYVRAFGSFTMDMFTPTNDLDISLNMEYGVENLSQEEKIKILRKLTKCLNALERGGGYVCNIQPILKAKVPVVKFLHCKTGIECDVSAENRDGMIKSDILRLLSSLDWRFRKLCFLVKAWANGHGINSSKDGTLNSLSIILLVAFHLQTRKPAILPPFSVFLEGSSSRTSLDTVSLVAKRVHQFLNFGRENTESVAQLFNSFFIQLVSVKDLWQEGLCVSTYEGTWTCALKPGQIFVEDFTALTQNTARAVRDKGFICIYQCLHETSMQFESYFRSLFHVSTLKSLLFSPPVKTSAKQRKRGLDDETLQTLENHSKQLKKSLTEPHDGMHLMSKEPNIFSEIANWVAFQEKPRHEVLGHDDMLRNTQRLTPATAEDVQAVQSPLISERLISLKSEHPTKNKPIYGERHMYLPTPSSLSTWQPNHAYRLQTSKPFELSRDELIHHNTLVSSMLQDRPSKLVTSSNPFDFQEATLSSHLHQQWPTQQYAGREGHAVRAHRPYSGFAGTQCGWLLPGFQIQASGQNGGGAKAVHSSLYRNPVPSYASRRLYDSNPSLVMHHPQRYEEYTGYRNRYSSSGWR